MLQMNINKSLLVRPLTLMLSLNHVQLIVCILITVFYQVNGKRTNVFVETSLQEILDMDDNNNNQCTFTEDSATMVAKYVSIYNMINVQDETISIRVVYSTGLAWIAFAFSSSVPVPLVSTSSSWIVPSTPIIGLPEENNVCQYNITGYTVDCIHRMNYTKGISPVTNQLIYQVIDDTTEIGSIATVLEFTMPLHVAFPDTILNTDTVSSLTPQSSQFIWTIGKSNKFNDMYSMTGTNQFESFNFCQNQNSVAIPPPPQYLPTNQPLSLTSNPTLMSPVFPATTNVTIGVQTTTPIQDVITLLSPSFSPIAMMSFPSYLPTSLKVNPTLFPTERMTSNPSRLPSKLASVPSSVPPKSSIPTSPPTKAATSIPTSPPLKAATAIPTSPPTKATTSIPTSPPLKAATAIPTRPPTNVATSIPTSPPTKVNTSIPTRPPTKITTFIPTRSPTRTTSFPTLVPTTKTTFLPTNNPTLQKVTINTNTTQKDCSYPIQSQRMLLSDDADTVDITNVVDQEKQTIRIKMTYNQKGYIAFGFNKSPFMVPATVIIGLPGTSSTTGTIGTSNVIGMYSLTGTSVSEIKSIPIEQQDAIFLDTVVLAQSDSSTTTTMEITLSLAVQYSADVGTIVTDPMNVLSKQNRFIWSAGYDNELKYHKHRGSDILQLNYC